VAPPPLAAAAARRPVLAALNNRPSTFRPAASGPSVTSGATRSTGTIVAFRLDVAARVTFTAQRRTTGVRSNGRCIKRTPGRRGPSCRRYVAQRGSFSHDAPAGRTTLRFTGRLNGRALARGTYRLRARARAGDLASAAADAAFRVGR
jgi:hypothetical protein